MKAYVISKGATTLDGLRLTEKEKPTPGPGQVLLKMHAASLNFRDIALLVGKYPGGPVQRDTVALSDGAGEIVEIGEGANEFTVGDRVAPTFIQGLINGPFNPAQHGILGSPLDGVLAEYMVVNENGMVKIPDHLSFEEAATLPCAGLTAWNSLMESTSMRPGQTVLILGTGGVSIFALQFARANGCRVIATSSSDEKLERAKAMGADGLINYKTTPDWEQEVLKLTDGAGVDNVIEVGGVGTLAKSYEAVGWGGQVSIIGVLAGAEGQHHPHPLMFKYARLQGIFTGNRNMFENMNKAITSNQIKPVVDKAFEFDEAADALQYQLAGKHFGKVVIAI